MQQTILLTKNLSDIGPFTGRSVVFTSLDVKVDLKKCIRVVNLAVSTYFLWICEGINSEIFIDFKFKSNLTLAIHTPHTPLMDTSNFLPKRYDLTIFDLNLPWTFSNYYWFFFPFLDIFFFFFFLIIK